MVRGHDTRPDIVAIDSEATIEQSRAFREQGTARAGVHTR
jgi:hypothetical protein